VVSAAFTCPRCGRTSHHPIDAQEGYCGYCHDWTAESWVKVRLWLGSGDFPDRWLYDETRIDPDAPDHGLERLAVVHANVVNLTAAENYKKGRGPLPYTVEFVFPDGEHVRFGTDPTIMVEPDYFPPDQLMAKLADLMRRRHGG
jgi:hypothetical protein